MNTRKRSAGRNAVPRRRRSVHFNFWATEEEAALIRERMASLGITGLGAYFRKMGIDGYIINLDLSDVRELVSLLRYCSNNLNQYAKRANETGNIYAADIEDLRERLDGIWEAAREILKELAEIQ